MKALTFIECYGSEAFSTVMQLVKIHKYYGLVSRPFRPEIILELFEGAVKSEKQERGYSIKEDYIDFGLKFYTINTKNSKSFHREFEFLFPEKIDQFISDCKRAGIELEWKEGVWE